MPSLPSAAISTCEQEHETAAGEARTDPVSRAELRRIAGIFGAAVLLRAVLQVTNGLVMWPDAHAYLVSALRMASRGDFLTHELYRTPLYPMFLSPFLSLFGVTQTAGMMIAAAQHALGIAAAVALYFFTRRNFGPRPAAAAAIGAAFLPLQLYYEHVAQTEALFIPLLIALVLVSTRDRAPSLGHALVLGVTAGLLTLARPIGQYLLIIAAGAWVWQFGRKAAPQVLVSLAVFAGVLWPWVLVNKATHGVATVSGDLGLNLFHKAFDVAHLAPVDDDRFTRVAELYRKRAEGTQVTYFSVYDDLLHRGRSAATADAVMKRYALAAIFAHPFAYIQNCAVTFVRLLFVPRNSIKVTRRHFRVMSKDPQFLGLGGAPSARGTFIPGLLYDLSFVIEPLLVLLAAAGALHLTKDRAWTPARAVPVLMALYLFAVTAAFNREEDRFRLPADLLLVPLAAYAACALLRERRGAASDAPAVSAP
jgi:4-amino-4-deoxy-L-arabinose transferase-like glycosyltransferase